MQVKRTLEQIKKLDYLKKSELAEYTGMKYATVKFYAGLGLLPYKLRGERRARYFPRIEGTARLKEITKMRSKGFAIHDIVEYYKKKG